MPATTPMPRRAPQHMRAYMHKSSLPRPGRVDSAAVLGVALLLVVGLIALFSASYVKALNEYGDGMFFVKRQFLFAVAGFIAMLFISKIDYHHYARYHKLLAGVAILLMLIVPIIGDDVKGAKRWIRVGPIQIQPSEILKVVLIICFAYYIVQLGDKMRTFRYGILPFAGALVAVAGMLYLQKHLSATVIMFGIGVAMMIVGGIRLWYILPIGAVAAPALIWYVSTKGYANARIKAWINPFDPDVFSGDGWQGANSQTAIGSGGFWGLGLGQGRQKHLYLPEPQNDFVFASWCEEMGFIGALLVILLFAYLIYRCYFIAYHAPDQLGCLIAAGIATKLAIQTLMNLFVVTGLFPVTGASLPFFSYGGTALMMQLGEMGIMLNISRRIRPSDKQKG